MAGYSSLHRENKEGQRKVSHTFSFTFSSAWVPALSLPTRTMPTSRVPPLGGVDALGFPKPAAGLPRLPPPTAVSTASTAGAHVRKHHGKPSSGMALPRSSTLPTLREHGAETTITRAAGQESSQVRRGQPGPSRTRVSDVMDRAVPFRSPLLTLEVQLASACSGEERSPTLSRAAACFGALRGLIVVASQPFKPLLENLARELWSSVYDGNRGGAAYFDELLRLRAHLAQRDAQLKRAEAEASRLQSENQLLIEELARVEPLHVPPPSLQAMGDGSPVPSALLSPALHGDAHGEEGLRIARLVSDASGRSVYDRVEDATRSMRHPSERAHRMRVRRRSEQSLARHVELDSSLLSGAAVSKAGEEREERREDADGGGGGSDDDDDDDDDEDA